MKELHVGVYDLGAESVEVQLRSGLGGDWTTRSDVGKMALIQVGADHEEWYGLVVAILHELMDLTGFRMGCIFRYSPNYSRDNGAQLFVYDHTGHSEMCARVGWFLADCLPDLARAWDKWKKEKKRRYKKAKRKK